MKIIILLCSGIGNAILFGPTLKELRKNYPKAKIDIISSKKSFAEPFKGSNLINNIFILNNPKVLIQLRKERYDISITAFPSNRIWFNLLAYLTGAKKRLTHSYKVGKLRTLSFLQNNKILADEHIHDVEQNLNLLKALNLEIPQKKELFFYISKDNEKWANHFINAHKLKEKILIGIHPGCNKKNKERRWPKEYFTKLINDLTSKNKNVLLFAGPDEIEQTKWILDNTKNKAKMNLIEEKNLKNVAALISKCNFFLSTDSGLGHIASALKVPTLSIFGPANPSRTRPYGKLGHYISANLPDHPTLKYPFYSTSSKSNCEKDCECLIKIKPIIVKKELNKISKKTK